MRHFEQSSQLPSLQPRKRYPRQPRGWYPRLVDEDRYLDPVCGRGTGEAFRKGRHAAPAVQERHVLNEHAFDAG